MEDRPDWAFGLFTPEAIEAKRAYYTSLRTENEQARVYEPRLASNAKPERNAAIWRERKEQGTTLAALGQKYGLTRGRIREIVVAEDRRLTCRVRFNELRKQEEGASYGG